MTQPGSWNPPAVVVKRGAEKQATLEIAAGWKLADLNFDNDAFSVHRENIDETSITIRVETSLAKPSDDAENSIGSVSASLSNTDGLETIVPLQVLIVAPLE